MASNVFTRAIPVLSLPLTGGTLTGNLVLPSAGSLSFLSRSQIQSSADGSILLLNNAGTAFTRLQMGGTTSAFPSFVRVGSSIQVVLADGSGWAGLQSGSLAIQPDTGYTAGGSAAMVLLFGNANTGLYVGSGVPTLSAGQGSIYLRRDGSTTSTRLYVNTNGATGWTSITTAT